MKVTVEVQIDNLNQQEVLALSKSGYPSYDIINIDRHIKHFVIKRIDLKEYNVLCEQRKYNEAYKKLKKCSFATARKDLGSQIVHALGRSFFHMNSSRDSSKYHYDFYCGYNFK